MRLFDQRGFFKVFVFVGFQSCMMPHCIQGWSEISKNEIYQKK